MKIKATVTVGHGVASGQGQDPRYPQGTLRAQYDYFRRRGLDLTPYFMGTVNVDIAPYSFEIKQPAYFIKDVDWSDHIPPENFYFFNVSLQVDERRYEGLIYLPDPATKTDHFQQPSVLELLLPRIDQLSYGRSVLIDVPDNQLTLASR